MACNKSEEIIGPDYGTAANFAKYLLLTNCRHISYIFHIDLLLSSFRLIESKSGKYIKKSLSNDVNADEYDSNIAVMRAIFNHACRFFSLCGSTGYVEQSFRETA
jgi:hypothetical protein